MALKTAANPLLEKMQMALALQKDGEIEKAQRLYKQVLKKAPNNPDANHLLGVCYRQLGYPKRAIEYIQKAINLANDRAPFYANLARAMADIPNSDTESILAMTQKALQLEPNMIKALNLQAVSLSRLDMKEEAEAIFQKLIVQNPDNIEAYRNYGIMLRDNKDFDKAVPLFFKCTLLEPDNPENYVHKARCRYEAKQFEIAESELKDALERFPGNGDLLHELARLLFQTGESYRGLEVAELAVKDAPKDPHRLVTLGVIQHGMCLYSEAISSFQSALAITKTPMPAAEWNLSLAYLGNGNLKMGWKHHHARFFEGHTSLLLRKFDRPMWDGSDISDKTIMVWNDQGIGDAYRFGTLIHDLNKVAGHVIIEVSQKLIPPFQRTFPDATVRLARFESSSLKATSDDYDYHICMGDLAKFYRNSYEDYEAARQPGYALDKEQARAFHDRIPSANKKPIVGLAWRSRNLAPSRARFYLSVPELAPLLETPEVVFVNLQYARIEREVAFLSDVKGYNFVDFADVDLLNDLEAAASLTACCDLVISANTSPAELAGCYGIPCWRFGPPESPLLLGQQSPPWYPKTEYLHPQMDQPAVSVVEILHERLKTWVSTSFSPNERLNRLGLLEHHQD